MKLELLKMLSDNGGPLHLTVHEEEGNFMISRDGGPSLPEPASVQGAMNNFRNRLAHYPQEVTINGERLETTPPPRSALALTQTPQGPNFSNCPDTRLQEEESPLMTHNFNTIAGGVCCRIGRQTSKEEQEQQVYLSPIEGSGNGQYRLLSAIKLEAHTEIHTQELDQLESRYHTITIPPDTLLEDRTRERRRLMREYTMTMPGMPARFMGHVYTYPLTRNIYEMMSPAFIEVMGTPVIIPESQTDDNARFVTAAETLMMGQHKLVPVGEIQGQLMGREFPPPGTETLQLQDIEFTQDPGDTHNPEHITMTARLSDGTALNMPAQFCLTGEVELFADCRVVPGSMLHPDLVELLIRAYWQEEDDNDEHQYHEMVQRMNNLATHLLGDTREGFRSEMKRNLDRFHTPVPHPREPVTVTSRNGLLTLTFNPNKQEETE